MIYSGPNFAIVSVRSEVMSRYEQYHFSATKAQMNMKRSVLERGDEDLSIKGSLILK